MYGGRGAILLGGRRARRRAVRVLQPARHGAALGRIRSGHRSARSTRPDLQRARRIPAFDGRAGRGTGRVPQPLVPVGSARGHAVGRRLPPPTLPRLLPRRGVRSTRHAGSPVPESEPWRWGAVERDVGQPAAGLGERIGLQHAGDAGRRGARSGRRHLRNIAHARGAAHGIRGERAELQLPSLVRRGCRCRCRRDDDRRHDGARSGGACPRSAVPPVPHHPLVRRGQGRDPGGHQGLARGVRAPAARLRGFRVDASPADRRPS